MKRPILAMLALAFSTAPLLAQPPSITAMAWLSACWELNAPNRRVIERWDAPSATEMRGSSRTIVGTREIEGERLRIYLVRDTLVYDARPSGQARTEFRTRLTNPDEIVFENPAHDFPQKISYRKVGTDSLVARIEGDRASRRQPVTYAFRRVSCEGIGPSSSDLAETALQPHYDELVTMLDAAPSGLNSWFAKHGTPTFNYVFWATAGYRAPVVTREQVDRILSTPAAATTMIDRTHRLAIERTLVRGDTAEVLLTLTMDHGYTDTPGRYGPPGERRNRTIEHQRLDRWIKAGDRWQLADAALLSDQISVEGKLVVKNGRQLP